MAAVLVRVPVPRGPAWRMKSECVEDLRNRGIEELVFEGAAARALRRMSVRTIPNTSGWKLRDVSRVREGVRIPQESRIKDPESRIARLNRLSACTEMTCGTGKARLNTCSQWAPGVCGLRSGSTRDSDNTGS